MLRFIVRRLLQAIPTLLILSLLVFVWLRSLRDPAKAFTRSAELNMQIWSSAMEASSSTIAAVTSLEVTSPEMTTWAGSVVEVPGKLFSRAIAPDLANVESGRDSTPEVPVRSPSTG